MTGSLIRAALVAALLVPATAGAQSSTLADGTRSSWQVDRVAGRPLVLGRAGVGRRVILDFVRADIEIRRSATDRIALTVRADTDPGLDRIVLRLDTTDREMRIVDVYPSRSGWTDECLPPSGEHGDFWLIPARLKAILAVPLGVEVRATAREGGVRDLRRR